MGRLSTITASPPACHSIAAITFGFEIFVVLAACNFWFTWENTLEYPLFYRKPQRTYPWPEPKLLAENIDFYRMTMPFANISISILEALAAYAYDFYEMAHLGPWPQLPTTEIGAY